MGYGCTTCIGNSGGLQTTEVEDAIGTGDLVCAAVCAHLSSPDTVFQ